MDTGAMQDISVIPDVGMLVLKSGGMLLVVLAVLMGCVFLLKRVSRLQHLAGQGALTVRGTYHLGTKERLMLVDVEGVRLLLGVTPSGIQTLHTFGEAAQGEVVETAPPSFFEALFKRQLGRGADKGKESDDES